jgi:hypothetical protein
VPLDEAATRLAALSGRRFYPILHHYELSNWILHVRARAGGPAAVGADAAVRAADRPRGADAPAAASSTMEFHSPQVGQRPCQRDSVCEQLWQRCCVRAADDLAMTRQASSRV